MKLTKSQGATVATVFTAILVIASLSSIIIMQTNNASASNLIVKQKIRGDVAVAQKTLRRKRAEIYLQIYLLRDLRQQPVINKSVLQCKNLIQMSLITVFRGCGPAQQLTIANGLGSATFSGKVTGFDFTTGEEKTVTVSAKLTATGKVEIFKFSSHTNFGDINEVFHSTDKIRSASGSLNIAGDINFSFDDAVGIIGKSSRWYNTSDKELVLD